MNILYVVQHYYPEDVGGAGKSVQMIAEALVRQGHTVSVVRIHDKENVDVYEHNGVKVYALPLHNLYYYKPHSKASKPPAWKRLAWHFFDIFNIKAMREFGRVLDEVKPDIVNTNTLSGHSTAVFYVVKKRGIKLVHTMRDYYLMCPQSSMFRDGESCESICNSCKPFAFVRRQACKKVDVFLSNSQFVEDRHKRHNMLPENAEKFVQYNMNLSGDMSAVRSRDVSRPLRFGFIGNLIPTKGVDKLIEACNQLGSDQWVLKIAGKGSDEYVASLQAKVSDKVEFLGWADARSFYHDVDILICPSTYHDPLPRVIYEAYKTGLPVIGSDTGGNPEIIEHGVTGYCYAADDVEALAEYLHKCLRMSADDYAAMSAAALAKAEIFEPDYVLAEYVAKITGEARVS